MVARPNLAVVKPGDLTSIVAVTPVTDSRVGATLGGSYRVVRRIGEGGMGAVYEAEHIRLHQRFAVKFLDPALASDREAYARFRQEAEIAASLAHDSIVDVVDFNVDDTGQSYMVMEFVEGVTLDVWAGHGRLSPKEALRVFEPLCSALAAAHAAGVVHRDLKPSNIMVCGQGSQLRVKLLDFGISKVKGALNSMTRANVVMGTPNYMSPEQASGNTNTVDVPTDIFALGALLYELLAGCRAFDEPSTPALLHSIVYSEPKPLSALVPELPEAVVAVVDKCLAKAQADRFADTQSLVVALRAAVRPPRRGAAVRVASEGPPAAKLGPFAFLGWGVALLVALGAGALWATSPAVVVTEPAEPPALTIPAPPPAQLNEPTYRVDFAAGNGMFLENENQLYRADARGLSYWPDPEAETTVRGLPSIAPVTALARSREGEIIVGQADGTISRWDHALRDAPRHQKLASAPVEQVAAAAGYIAVASGNDVHLYRGVSGKSLRTFSASSAPLSLLFARHPKDTLYILRADGMEIVDVDRRKSLAVLPLLGQPVRARLVAERVDEPPEIEIDFVQGDWIVRRSFRVQPGARGQSPRLEPMGQRRL